MALCTVTGIVYLPTGEPARSRVFVFSPANRSIYPDNFGGVLPDPVWVKTNRDGLLSVVLLTGTYVVQSEVYSGSVVVPDAPLANLYQILGGGGDVPAAPSVVEAPSVEPTTAMVGDNVTLRTGVWQDSDTETGILMQGAVNRTSEIVDQVWSPAVAGAFTWSVSATGPGGTTVATPISGTIDAAAPPVEPIGPSDYWAYAEPSDAPGAVGSNLTTLTARGTGAPAFSIAATGTAPTKESNAIRFNLGQYFMADALTIPAGDGFIIAADFTPRQVTGTQNVIMISTTQGVILGSIRSANTAAQYNVGVGVNGTAVNVASGPMTVGGRIQMAIEFDRVAGTLRSWNLSTGAVVSQPLTYSGSLNAVRISIGQASNHSVHRVSMVARPTGAAWGTTLEEVLEDYGLTGGGAPSGLTAMRIEVDTGQSLGLGPNEGNTASPAGPLWRDVLASNRVRGLGGTYRSDNVLITQVAAPLLKGYDTARSATSDIQGYAVSNIPPGFVSALATVRDGLAANTGIAYQFHGAGGQSITALASGIPYDNFAYWIAQVGTRFAGLSRNCPAININQGEADISQPRGWWLERAGPMVANMTTAIRAATGQTSGPSVFINQTGGYMLKTGAHLVVLDQIDVVRNLGARGVLVQPIYALKISNADGRGVHMGTEGNLMLGEIQAWAKQVHEAGQSWNLFPAATASRSGDNITIAIPVRSDETLTTEVGKYLNYGGDPTNLGLEAVGGGAVTSATVSGGNINLTVTGTVTAIRYAMQATGIDYRTFTDSNNEGYATHRGIIRTTLTRTRTVGGIAMTLKRFIPSFEVTIT